MKMTSQKTHTKKLAGFAQRILCSLCHTVIQKWNRYSVRLT